MKANFNVTGSDRKEMVRIIGNTVGMEPVYKFMPTCAYVISNITVEKNGTMVWDERTDAETIEKVMAALAAAGFTAEETTEAEEAETDQAEETGETERAEDAEEMAEGEEEADETEETVETTEEADEAETADETEEAPAEPFPIDTTVSFPISQHSSTSLVNLVCMIYSRGPILSKATGGQFGADKELVEALQSETLCTAKSVVDYIAEWEKTEKPLTGIAFTGDRVSFTGFTGAKDAEHVQTFMKLAALINKSAITQKRVLARETDMTNEKYALRNWLIRLGMDGNDYKADRKILMEKLSGHVAFRTPADEEKWKARQQEKRDALKTAKEAAEV